jgi:hypothetical protein
MVVLCALVLCSHSSARATKRARAGLRLVAVIADVLHDGELSQPRRARVLHLLRADLVPSYFIISGWGGAQRSKAALKFFIYTFTGSAFLFVGILYLGFLHQHQTGGALTFSYSALLSATR